MKAELKAITCIFIIPSILFCFVIFSESKFFNSPPTRYENILSRFYPLNIFQQHEDSRQFHYILKLKVAMEFPMAEAIFDPKKICEILDFEVRKVDHFGKIPIQSTKSIPLIRLAIDPLNLISLAAMISISTEQDAEDNEWLEIWVHDSAVIHCLRLPQSVPTSMILNWLL